MGHDNQHLKDQMIVEADMRDEVNESLDAEDKLERISQALDDYHQALRDREHGGVASGNLVDKIEEVFGRYYS